MRVGIQIRIANIPQKITAKSLAHLAEQADRAGFSTLTVPDQFSVRPESTEWSRRDGEKTTPTDDFLEAWSSLAFIAAHTSRIRLSTLTTSITWRYPAVLVKTVDTLDVLSNGRACLGLGAGPDFSLDQHQRMGVPFPAAGERVARLEEVLQLAHQLWSGEDKPFDSKYYHLESTVGTPFFVQQPHPPILIAGQGDKVLRLMARCADIVSIGFGQETDKLHAKLDVLREQCERIGRPYAAIEKTTFFTPAITQNGHLDPSALDTIVALAELGIDEIMVMVRNLSDLTAFAVFASELIPAVADIQVADR